MKPHPNLALDIAPPDAEGASRNRHAIHTAAPQDEATLWRALCCAALMPGGDTPENITAAKEHVVLSKYVANWGQPGDVGVVADAKNGEPAGAAWVRPGMHAVWSEQGLSTKFYQPEMNCDAPELVVAVFTPFRNMGLGHALLNALVHTASHVYSAIQLNVREENPAVRLYERVGFTTVGEITNRVGGRSVVMLKLLVEKKKRHVRY